MSLSKKYPRVEFDVPAFRAIAEEFSTLRARQNVVHELGLFQGRLGFTKAIVLLEDGTEEFSNIHGVQQIRYGKGNIKETFGEVLGVLRREFEA